MEHSSQVRARQDRWMFLRGCLTSVTSQRNNFKGNSYIVILLSELSSLSFTCFKVTTHNNKLLISFFLLDADVSQFANYFQRSRPSSPLLSLLSHGISTCNLCLAESFVSEAPPKWQGESVLILPPTGRLQNIYTGNRKRL